MSRDYYAVLEVDRWSDAPAVEHAYHTQARRFRRGPEADPRVVRHVEQAFHVLGEPQLRGSYDRALLDMLETAPPRSDDIIQMLEVSFDQAALGGKIAVDRIAPTGPESVDVRLPRGIEEGTLLRIGGLGLRAEPGDHAGDLILLVHVRPHPRLRRDGLDLYLDVNVPTDVARHGGRVRAGTLEGEIELDVPAGVRGGEKLLLRRAGLRDEADRRGDLYAVVQLQMSTLDQPAVKAPADTQRLPETDHDELTRTLTRRLDQLARDEAEVDHRRTVTRNWEKQLAARQVKLDARAERVAQRRQRLTNLRRAIKARRRQAAAVSPAVEVDTRPLQQMQQKLEQRQRDLAHQQQRLWEHRERFDHDREELERERREQARARRLLDDQRADLEQQAAELDHHHQRLAVTQTNLERRRRRLRRARRLVRERSAAARREAKTVARAEPPALTAIEHVRLIMLAPDGRRRTIQPVGGALCIGRDGACDLRIPVSTVSRRHCRIELRDGVVILRDVGSRNGTYHNGRPVRETTLHEGDSIAVGPVHFTVAVAE